MMFLNKNIIPRNNEHKTVEHFMAKWMRLITRPIRNKVSQLYEGYLVLRLLRSSFKFQPNPDANTIVSITSFPARIDNAWLSIETLLRQDFAPSKVILVLSEEEFPTKELPPKIQRQVQRGLEILWTPRNMRSYNKLLPVRQRFQDANIVTFDDDILYEPWRLRKLIEASKTRPHTIVGHRGSTVTMHQSSLSPYLTWDAAGPSTCAQKCFLTGVGGILYPPHVLPIDLLLDYDLALRLCPTADDIWFWTISQQCNVPRYCLGNNKLRSVRLLDDTPALRHNNCELGANDVQLNSVMKYFSINNL